LNPSILHATTVAAFRDGGWAGVLIRGASGAGKSDLALRLLAAGWRLVADDRTVAWPSGGRLWARAPKTLAGLIEARGLGIAGAAPLELAPIVLAVDLVDRDETLERTPEQSFTDILEIRLPEVRIFAMQASAAAKVAVALSVLESRSSTGVSSRRAGPRAGQSGGGSR
jgi:serine kinase of HPr protein (carbohydrate metabolism regulator)